MVDEDAALVGVRKETRAVDVDWCGLEGNVGGGVETKSVDVETDGVIIGCKRQSLYPQSRVDDHHLGKTAHQRSLDCSMQCASAKCLSMVTTFLHYNNNRVPTTIRPLLIASTLVHTAQVWGVIKSTAIRNAGA